MKEHRVLQHYIQFAAERMILIQKEFNSVNKLLDTIRKYEIYTELPYDIEILIGWFANIEGYVTEWKEQFYHLSLDIVKHSGVVRITKGKFSN